MSSRIPGLVLVFLIGDLIVALLAAANVLWLGRRLFALEHETNLPTWFSTIQLYMIGLLLAAFAVAMLRRRAPGAGWLLLWPAFFFFLSLDELAMLHERMPDAIRGAVFPVTGAWMLVYAPVAGAAAAAMAYATRRFWLPYRDVTAMFAGGMLLYAIAAAGIEILVNFARGPSQLYVQIFAEEIGEMLAATLLLWASHRLLARHGLRLGVVASAEPAGVPEAPG